MFQKRINKGVNNLNNEVINQLPPSNNTDNGKVLMVSEGKWVANDLPPTIDNGFITQFTNNSSDSNARITVYRLGKMVTVKVQNWNGNVIEGTNLLFDRLPKPKDISYHLDQIPVFCNVSNKMEIAGKVYLGVSTYDDVSFGKVSRLVKNDESIVESFSFEFSYFTN